MSTSVDIHGAARHLIGARQRRQPGARLPESCRPATLEEGLSIQRAVRDLLGQPVGGWKCSLPKPDRIIAGPIFAPSIYRESPCPIEGNGPARIEPEIAFVLGRGLPPRGVAYGEEEIIAAIGEVRLALELVGCRYAEPKGLPFPEMLADGVSNEGLFVGPVLRTAPRDLPEAFTVTLDGPEGNLITKAGKHPDGHPLRPFCWLAGFLNERGEGLEQGQIVITGSYAGVLDAPLQIPLRIGYGDFGAIQVEFRRAST